MKLYSMPGTCALSVHITLEWVACPFQLVLMNHGDNHSPSYQAVNPSGKVPAIVLADGKVLTQASAILSWLVNTYPDAQIGSSAANPLAHFALEEMLAYLTSDVHPAFGPFFAAKRFLADESQFEALKKSSLSQVAGHMTEIDGMLAKTPFILGEHPTVADAYLYVLSRWIDNLDEGIKPFPNLARFRARMESDPAVSRALTAQGMKPLGAGS
jgi:glutathione S-transferase